MTVRAWVRRVAVVLVGGGALACAARSPWVPGDSPFAGDPSLSAFDAAVRHYLTARDTTALPELLARGPRDRLLQHLTAGIYLHRLGRYQESNAQLQAADALAEERYTKSISQNVAAFVVSDNVLDFYPSAQEWSMIHYYGMLNYLYLGLMDDALVEARRANALLRRYANDNPGRTFTDPPAVEYVAGLLQWHAGEIDNGVISLQQSLRSFERYEEGYGMSPPAPVVEDLARTARLAGRDGVVAELERRYGVVDSITPPSPTGELLLLFENGFVAHRAEQKVYIPVLASEKDSVLAGDAESAVVAAVTVLIRTLIVMNYLSEEGVDYPRHEDGVIIATVGSAVGLELLTLAWPSYRLNAQRATGVRVAVGDEPLARPALLQDLSTVAVRDFEEGKPTIMLRMIARGLLKEAGVTAAEAAGERAGGALGGFLGRVGSRALAAATERADTRTWSALPAELLVARWRLPPGTHDVRIEYDGLHGPEQVEFTVEIEAGALTVESIPLVGDDPGATQRFRAAARGVRYRMGKQ